ncbi:MAG: Sec-independent protein translocase protein TatB [Gordonia sp. (in: high G+C Gram-positive bacteria)]|uniref:Sec-independent protein translocase protein TatB n=1 Tax=Gordonia sp. (in: high G+C Gram-positive bacteria) TaxID=84139 RepID=UPI003BB5BD9D
MFSSVGWGEILVLIALALVILGPERLPGAISWTMGSLRKARDYATGASKDLQEQMGTDFDSFREPLQQLNELRQMSPKSLVTKHLFDGDASTLDEMEDSVRDSLSISGPAPANPHPVFPAGHREPAQADPAKLNGAASGALPTGGQQPPAPSRRRTVADWDAT